VTAAIVHAYRQPYRFPDGSTRDAVYVLAQCQHGGANVRMLPSMFEDAAFLASFERLEAALRQAAGCDCTAMIPPDVEIETVCEVSL